MHFDRPYGPLRKKIWARFVINAHVWIVVSVSEVICPKRETKLSRSVRSSIPRYARHFSSPLTIIPRYAGQGTRCIKPRLPWHAASSQSPIYHHCTSLIQLGGCPRIDFYCDRLQILMAALSSPKRPQRRLLLRLRPFWPCRLALKIFARSRYEAILGQPPSGIQISGC